MRKLLVSLVLCCSSATVLAEPWQNITQPIGVLLVDPPETAFAVNTYLMSLDPNITPATFPFDLATDVTKILTTREQYFVRVYDEPSGSGPVGSWIMRASQARGLTAQQIRDIQALPALPTRFTYVKVPSGITMYTGIAGAIAGWGEGGATQSKIMGPPYVPRDFYINRQLIGDCFLCYRVLAPSGNAHRVALALDQSSPVPYSSLDTLYDNLDMLYFGPTQRQFQDSLNALSGEAATASQQVLLDSTASFVNAIQQKASQWLAGAMPRAGVGAHQSAGGWASLKGGSSMLRGDAGTATVNASGTGLQIGMDRQVNQDLLVGAALGAMTASYSVNDRASQGSLSGVNAALYSVGRSGRWYLAGTLAYAWASADLDRSVAVNQLYGQYKGSYSSQVLSVRLEAGYLARLDSVNLTPFVAIEPGWLWQGAFTENMRPSSGPQVNMGLNFQSQQVTSMPLSLGIQVDSRIDHPDGWIVSPMMRLSWIHQFSTRRQVNAALQLLPAQTFTVYGAAAPENAGRLTVGISASSKSGMTAYFTLDGSFSDTSQAFAAMAGLNMRF